MNDQQAPQEKKPSASSMACAVFTGCALLSTALVALFVVPIAGYIYFQGKESRKREVASRKRRDRRGQLEAKMRYNSKAAKERKERERALARLRARQKVKKPTRSSRRTSRKYPSHRTKASTKWPRAPKARKPSPFLVKLRQRKVEEKKSRARLYQHLCFINQKRIISGLKDFPEVPLGHLEPLTLEKLQKSKVLSKPFIDPGQHSETFDHYFVTKKADKVDVICTRHGASSTAIEDRSAKSPAEQAKAFGIEGAMLEPFSKIAPLNSSNFSTPKIVQVWAMKISAQGQQVWRKIYKESRQLRAISVQPSPEGYLSLSQDGRISSKGATVYLHSLSKEGQIKWEKTIANRKYKRTFSSTPAKGGALLAGATSKTTRGLQDATLSYFSWQGELKWEAKFGSGRKAITKSACHLQDGNILAVGYYDKKPFMAWVSEDTGYVIKTEVLERVRHGKLYSLCQNQDGLICLLGTIYTKGKAGSEFLLAGLSTAGKILWQSRLGAKRVNEPATVLPLRDNEFLMGGTVAQSFGTKKQMWLHARNPQGETTFQAGFEGEKVTAIVATADGGFIVAGTTREYAMGRRDIWLIRFNKDKTIQWQKTLGGENDEVPLSIYPTTDGSFIVGGESYYYGLSEREAETAKLEQYLYVPFVPTDTIMDIHKTNFAEANTAATLAKQ